LFTTSEKSVGSVSATTIDVQKQHEPRGIGVAADLSNLVSADVVADRLEADRFDEEYPAFVEADLAVGVPSGTVAFRFALTAFGNGPGDGPLTVSKSFDATLETITEAGARPVFADANRSTGAMDRAVPTESHCPTPAHIQSVHRHLGYAPGSLPESEVWAFEALTLPPLPELTEAEVYSVCEAGGNDDVLE
jgi:dTDP-4-amino-4,6-dideoxygalactose transaminase